MQSASIVLALCLLAKASAESSYASWLFVSDLSEACAAAYDAVLTANGENAFTCLDTDGNEVEPCNGGEIDWDNTATYTAAGKCTSLTMDLQEAETVTAAGGDYVPMAGLGTDPCSEDCTSGIDAAASECTLDESWEGIDAASLAACPRDESGEDPVDEEEATIVSSATMAGAAVALIAVAVF